MWTGFAIGLALYLIVVATRSTFRVPEGHVATLERFGAAVFENEKKKILRLYTPGLHFKYPWEHATRISLMEQNLDLSGEAEGRSAMTEDGTLLRFDSILRYAPVKEHLYEFVYGMRSPLEHIKGLFTCLLRNEIANFRTAAVPGSAAIVSAPGGLPIADGQSGSYALLRRERRLLNEHIETFCRERIGGRYGVRFNAVDLVDILPPDELADALNSVMSAHAEAQTAYFRAEGESQQRVMAAERGVAIAKEHAHAAELEVLTLGHALAQLRKDQVLSSYVKRRREEVLSESRVVYVKEAST
jgi:regulator of protease activity HflC (stomatin/prohibitin superfamily)